MFRALENHICWLDEFEQVLHGQPGFPKNPSQNFRLEWLPWMNRDDKFEAGMCRIAKCNVTAHLMINVPACPTQGPNQTVPWEISGQLGHTATSTVASSKPSSSGTGSPCFKELSM